MTRTRLTNRRKTFLINREIQIGITVRFIVVFVLFMLLATLIVFFPSALKLFMGHGSEELARPAREFLILNKRVWPMVILVIGGFVVYSVLFTHRLAGPVYRLNKELKKLIDGTFPERIALRDKDFFKETAALLEELSRSMRERSGGGAADHEEILKKLSLLREEMQGVPCGEKCIPKLDRIAEMIRGKHG